MWFQCFALRPGFSVGFKSGFIVPVSKLFQRSGFSVGFKAVSIWRVFKFGFKVCFSIGIFPNMDDVQFQTGSGVFQSNSASFRLQLSREGFSAGFKPGFRVRFQIQFQTTVSESTCQVKV